MLYLFCSIEVTVNSCWSNLDTFSIKISKIRRLNQKAYTLVKLPPSHSIIFVCSSLNINKICSVSWPKRCRLSDSVCQFSFLRNAPVVFENGEYVSQNTVSFKIEGASFNNSGLLPLRLIRRL